MCGGRGGRGGVWWCVVVWCGGVCGEVRVWCGVVWCGGRGVVWCGVLCCVVMKIRSTNQNT